MVRGFVEMQFPQEPSDGSATLQAGSANHLESVLAMRQPWRVLADGSDMPTTQFEWTVAAMNQHAVTSRPYIAYVNDGSNLRAVLPLVIKPRRGVEHFQFISSSIPMPIDIPHVGQDALAMLLTSVTKAGRPIFLGGMVADSPATAMLREMAQRNKGRVQIEDAQPISYLSVPTFALQDRINSAARVSIIATSYGLSGGPNDVIFQYVSPSLDQVMQLFHESLQLQAAPRGKAKPKQSRNSRNLDILEFMRTYAYNSAQRGEIRFSCIRLAGRLLAMQMLQVRGKTAWLLTAGNLERFRDTTLGTLLMGETIRKLQQESIERLVLPSPSTTETGETRQISCVDVTIYPFSSRALMAKLAGRVSGLLRRRTGETRP